MDLLCFELLGDLLQSPALGLRHDEVDEGDGPPAHEEVEEVHPSEGESR